MSAVAPDLDAAGLAVLSAAADGADLDVETLDSLLLLTRSPTARSAAAATGTLPAVLRRLSAAPDSLLLLHLRLLRNLLFESPQNQTQFLDSSGPDRVASILLRSPPVSSEIVRAALQVLGNAALAGELLQAAVWDRFFPTWFGEMAKVRAAGVVDPLCMVMDSCLTGEGGRKRFGELCGKGLGIVVEIVETACHAGYHEEWLEWLLCKVCVEEGYFSTVFARLGMNNHPARDNGRHNLLLQEQAFLLATQEKFMTNCPQEIGRISKDFALGVLNVLKESSAYVDFTTTNKSTLPTDPQALSGLPLSLNILKNICSMDRSDPQIIEDSINSLLSAGLLGFVLGLLQELEAPAIVQKSSAKAGSRALLPSVGTKICPYKGYRRDLVSVIANCVHRRKQVQDEIRQRGAIPLLLQQCVIDDDNPFLREWGIMAVRNLLEGNLENQEEVADMELKGSVNTPQIAALGLKVEIDEKSQRPKLVNIQQEDCQEPKDSGTERLSGTEKG